MTANRASVLKWLLITTLGYGGVAKADEVRNGGDHVRIVFNEGRSRAVDALKTFSTDAVDPHISASAKAWLGENAAKLAADLEQSELVWNEKLPDNCGDHHCACTGLTPKSDIHLSQQACNMRFVDSIYAAKLLIHEGVHHFGLTDESFADEVAVAVMDRSLMRPRLYATLGDVMLPAPSTSAAPTPDGSHRVAFLLEQRGVVETKGGAGIAYSYMPAKRWGFEGSYFYSKVDRYSLNQRFSMGAKYLLSDRRVSPYSLARLSYAFSTSENADLKADKSYEYGMSEIGIGIGIEARAWEQCSFIGDVERALMRRSHFSSSDEVQMPAAAWNARLGVAVGFQ